MPGHRPLLIAACFAGSVIVAACAGGAAPVAPTLAVPAGTATAPLMVQVDKICAGQEADIRVFVDLVPIGVTNPGDAGVSTTVAVGAHQLSAISKRGTQWGPFSTTVAAGGRLERLGCLPADAL